MSTETADISSLDDTALTALYDDLLDQARDADAETLDELEDRTSEVYEEREKRKAKPKAEPAPKVTTIADQISDLKAKLETAQKLAEEAVTERRPNAGRVKEVSPTIAQVVYDGDEDWKAGRLSAFEVAGIQQEIAELEQRLPFADKPDDVLLAEAEELEIRSGELNARLKELDPADPSLRAARIRREAEEARAQLGPMMGELNTRKREAKFAEFSEQAAARRALRLRDEAARDWREEVAKKQAELDKAVKMNFLVEDAANDLAKAKQGLAAVEEVVRSRVAPDQSELDRAREWFDQFQDTHRVGRTSFEVEV